MSAGGEIIVKKVINVSGGHHGGAWKVAYADFVTAMMAFFLLLWLLNVTTDEQKNGIADYFAPKSVSRSQSGAGGLMGGISMATEGARISQNSPPTVVVELSPPKQRKPTDEDSKEPGGELDEDELLKQMAEREQKQFEEAEQQIRQAIQESPELAAMANQLIIDNTPEGLRIQLVDQERQSMFSSGSATMDGGAAGPDAEDRQGGAVDAEPHRDHRTHGFAAVPFPVPATATGNSRPTAPMPAGGRCSMPVWMRSASPTSPARRTPSR